MKEILDIIREILNNKLIKIGLWVAIINCAYMSAVNWVYGSPSAGANQLILGALFTIAKVWIFGKR